MLTILLAFSLAAGASAFDVKKLTPPKAGRARIAAQQPSAPPKRPAPLPPAVHKAAIESLSKQLDRMGD